MIAYIKGSIGEIGEDHVVLEANGVGYQIFLTKRHVASLPPEGKTHSIYTYLIQKEESMTLYGFETPQERSFFSHLKAISGVGPKTALSILSTLKPQELADAILNGRSGTIAQAPGVGKKIAERIVLELKGKLQKMGHLPVALPSQVWEEIEESLSTLGYSLSEIGKAIQAVYQKGETDDVDLLIQKVIMWLHEQQ